MTDRSPHAQTARRWPTGTTVIFRTYRAPQLELADMLKMAARYRWELIIASPRKIAARTGTRRAGWHRPSWSSRASRLRRSKDSAAAHSIPEAIKAARNGFQLILLSPVFATTSHPNADELGAVRLGLMTRQLRHRVGNHMRIVALGGINHDTVKQLPPGIVNGIAAMDAFGGVKRRESDGEEGRR
ncbi:MAG: thiamine phosphate synthase [Pseudomonadota bacterium]